LADQDDETGLAKLYLPLLFERLTAARCFWMKSAACLAEDGLHLWIESRLKNGAINVAGEVFLSAEKVMIISALAMPRGDKYSRQVLGLQS
jgi:hypothetical protein